MLLSETKIEPKSSATNNGSKAVSLQMRRYANTNRKRPMLKLPRPTNKLDQESEPGTSLKLSPVSIDKINNVNLPNLNYSLSSGEKLHMTKKNSNPRATLLKRDTSFRSKDIKSGITLRIPSPSMWK